MMGTFSQYFYPKKSSSSRWVITVSLIILSVLAFFQINLPLPSNKAGVGVSERVWDDFHKGEVYEVEASSSSHRSDIPYYALNSDPPRIILGNEIRYVINNPICDSVLPFQNPFLLILVTSYVGDVETRRKVREILPQSTLDQIRVKRLFLLARPPPLYQNKDAKYTDVNLMEIYEENEKYHDILLGDFTESYRSLTFKHLMGLDWAVNFCPNAKFVLKQDDDIIVDYYQLRDMLINEGQLNNLSKLGEKIANPTKPAIYGKVLEKQRVERDPTSKWFVSKDEFNNEIYPSYVSGWAYVTTIEALKEILRVSQTSKYFFIDDAFVTGILREKTKVTVLDMAEYFTTFKGQILCCVSVPMFAKSKNNEPYWCDYLAGPSNDDLELMEIYQRHSQYCFVSKQCKRREENERLEKKCVITGNMKVQDFSQFHGPGKPQPVIRKQ